MTPVAKNGVVHLLPVLELSMSKLILLTHRDSSRTPSAGRWKVVKPVKHLYTQPAPKLCGCQTHLHSSASHDTTALPLSTSIPHLLLSCSFSLLYSALPSSPFHAQHFIFGTEVAPVKALYRQETTHNSTRWMLRGSHSQR